MEFLYQSGGVGENRTPNRLNVNQALFRIEITTPKELGPRIAGRFLEKHYDVTD